MSTAQKPGTTAEELIKMIPALRIYARNLTPDWDEADDLVQHTLTTALAHVGRFRAGTDLRLWLFSIMRNSARSAATLRCGQRAGGTGGMVIGFPKREAPVAASYA